MKRVKLTRKELGFVRKAMQIVARSDDHYSCIALEKAQNNMKNRGFTYLTDEYGSLFRCTEFGRLRFAWGIFSKEEAKNIRLTMLCLFAEVGRRS